MPISAEESLRRSRARRRRRRQAGTLQIVGFVALAILAGIALSWLVAGALVAIGLITIGVIVEVVADRDPPEPGLDGRN